MVARKYNSEIYFRIIICFVIFIGYKSFLLYFGQNSCQSAVFPWKSSDTICLGK